MNSIKEQIHGGIPGDSLPVTLIAPRRGPVSLGLRELFNYRELLFFLAWRDVKVHYKQAALGVAWAVLQPLLIMVVFSFVFGRVAMLPSQGIPYPVFTFAALLPWQLFAGALARSSTSLVSNSNLITKVYFPRLVIPIAAAASGLVDFAVSLVVLVGLMFWYGIVPTWSLLVLPVFTGMALVSSLAISFWLSALNVRYRDVQYAVPFLIQAWMFLSPVAYTGNLVPKGFWRILYSFNPMAGVIDGFRWALLGAAFPSAGLLVPFVSVTVLAAGGLVYFKSMERSFADVV